MHQRPAGGNYKRLLSIVDMQKKSAEMTTGWSIPLKSYRVNFKQVSVSSDAFDESGA